MNESLSIQLDKRARKQRTDESFRPRLYEMSRKDDAAEVAAMIEHGDVLFVHDEIETQLAGLIETMNPAASYSKAETKEKTKEHLQGAHAHQYGVWAHYPWSRRLVHVLPEEEFRLLRTSRNRNKITFEEQEILRKLRIGVVGLSIGHAAATTLTMEEIGGELYLADFDFLELSNTNRIRAGVECLGVNKSVIAARHIYEMNPFAHVTLFTEGATEKNIDEFLRPGGTALDLVYEECDDLQMKILVRERARALRIPVLMETSDRGMMDIERFDREPNRPVFHGLTGNVRASDLKGLSTYEKVPIVLKILNQEGISERMAASMVDIETTLASWPQLASEVALGAALNVDIARRIALGQLNTSGRFYADLAEIVADGKSVALDPSISDEMGIVPEALGFDLPPIETARVELSEDQIRTLVTYGAMGFSGGNCQPWRFVFVDDQLRCFHEAERSRSFLDFQNTASYLAFGSVVENICLAGRSMGVDARVVPFPDASQPDLVCNVELPLDGRGQTVSSDGLVDQIGKRVTNRRLGDRVRLPLFELEALSRIAAGRGARLQWLSEDTELDEIGEILAEADLLRMTSKTMHAEMMHELRWTPEEVKNTRDGLDVATLEMSATDLAGLKLIRSWRIMRVTDAIGGGLGLKRPMRRCIRAASAVGLLTVPGLTPTDFLHAGRVLQHVWLSATAEQIAFQPVTPLTYLFFRLEHGGAEGLSEKEVQKLTALREPYRRLFEVPEGHAEPMLFRVARADPPTARSLRRRVESILTISPPESARFGDAG